MVTGLNTGFGYAIGRSLINTLADTYWLGHRIALFPKEHFTPRPGVTEPPPNLALLESIVAEYEGSRVKPLWIASLKTLPYIPTGSWATFHNEPNLHGYAVGSKRTGVHPAYISDVRKALALASERNIRLHVGGASNTEPNNLRWTANLLAAVPEIEAVEFHDYGGPSGDPDKPHSGFDSREEGFQALRDVIGDRHLVIGEFGVRNVQGVSEDQQAVYIHGGFQLYQQFNVNMACVFQLNDGQPPELWGIRAVDGRWKPSSHVASVFAPSTGVGMAGMGYERMLEPVHGTRGSHHDAGNGSIVVAGTGGQFLHVSADGVQSTRAVLGGEERIQFSKCGGWAISNWSGKTYVMPFIEQA